MKTIETIINDEQREIVVNSWSRMQLEKSLDIANVIEINDDDYRSVSLPCRPFGEKLH